VGDNVVRSQDTIAAQQRQANNCALALEVKESILQKQAEERARAARLRANRAIDAGADEEPSSDGDAGLASPEIGDASPSGAEPEP
jgi:hypothetical protein